jgi:phage-related protein
MDLRLVAGSELLLMDGSQGYYLTDATGLTMPPPEHQAVRGVGMDGAVWLGTTYGPRQVELRLMLAASSMEQRHQRLSRLATLLAPHSEVRLEAVRADGVYSLRCRLTDMAVRYRGPLVAEVQLQLRAFEPFWLGQLTHVDWNTTAAPGGGPAIPFAIPFAISSEGNAVNVTVANPGQLAAYPTIVLIGPAAAPIHLSHQNLNARLVLAYSLGDDEGATIDMQARTARATGGRNLYDRLSGQFWPLLPGTNQLRFSAQSSLRGQLRFTPRYLGVV